MAGLFSWAILSWTANVRGGTDDFPLPIPRTQIPMMLLIAMISGSVLYRTCKKSAWEGALFAAFVSAIGAFASRWPSLSRALELNGAVFAGPFIGAILTAAVTATTIFAAASDASPEWRPVRNWLWLTALLCWAAPTAATEFALTRWYGFGSRSLAQSAGLWTQRSLPPYWIYRFDGRRGRSLRPEKAFPDAAGLSPEDLVRIQAWLNRVGYRGIFAAKALSRVRRGWLLWWESDRALDAMMISVPGRAHPDYRGALDLIKVGPLTPARYRQLERLDRSAASSSAGFEDVTTSQYIFEGFAAAYARYGDEENARRWLLRIDNLFGVSDKKLEVAPLEDFRQGRISGSLRWPARGVKKVVVGLFQIWRSTPSASGTRLLSSSVVPDASGRFRFTHLGPGEYELGLLGPVSALRGRIESSPRHLTIDFQRPSVELPAIVFSRSPAAEPLAIVRPGQDRGAANEADRPFIWRKR